MNCPRSLDISCPFAWVVQTSYPLVCDGMVLWYELFIAQAIARFMVRVLHWSIGIIVVLFWASWYELSILVWNEYCKLHWFDFSFCIISPGMGCLGMSYFFLLTAVSPCFKEIKMADLSIWKSQQYDNNNNQVYLFSKLIIFRKNWILILLSNKKLYSLNLRWKLIINQFDTILQKYNLKNFIQ